MRFHAFLPLAAALANVVVCIPALRRGMRQPLIRAFTAMTACVVSWDLGLFSLYHFEDPRVAEWWNRVFRTGICFAPVTAYQFALMLSGTRDRMRRLLLLGGYVIGAALAIANANGLLVAGLEPHAWGWYIRPRASYWALSLFLGIYLPLTLAEMFHAYRHAESSRQRVQAKFALLAAAVQVPFVFTNVIAIHRPNVIYPIGDLGNVFYVAIVGYAIVRHRLMDVDYVVRKIVSFLLAGAVVLGPGAVGIAWLNVLLGADEPGVLTCAALALALLAVVLIPTLQEALETRVHRALFPNLYDYRLRLRQLGAALVHLLDQARLVRRLGDELTDILEVEACAVFVRDEQSRRLVPAYPSRDAVEPLPDAVAARLETLAQPTLVSELEMVDPAAFALVRARAWEVVVPLRVDQRVFGLVALGRNKDYRIFSGEDLQILGAVAAGASVALENASLSRQLRQSEIVLERANQLSSLGMLAAGIAHEIRNPLVAVKTFLDLLPQRLGDEEFLTQFRDLSLSELRRVTDLITDLLALGKSKTPERCEVNLAQTLEPVVRLMESSARKRQVEVRVRFESRLPAIYADPDQLKQIVLNLLLNAIESSAARQHVILEVRPAGQAVVLEVRDHGAGIPADQLESIFHPFFTTKEAGTGLGLALVHQMVLEHGGQITVESALGRGTTFRVTLPTTQFALAQTGT